jgi:hypothetical protein
LFLTFSYDSNEIDFNIKSNIKISKCLLP